MWGTGRDPKKASATAAPQATTENPPKNESAMKERNNTVNNETAISIVGPGMKIVGDCLTDGTVRIEGRVEGSVRAGKAVVVGKEGIVEGDIETQDAVVSGVVNGTINAESRLELQATCRIEGEVYARRMQLEEGAILNGRVHMGENRKNKPASSAASSQAKGASQSNQASEASPTHKSPQRAVAAT